MPRMTGGHALVGSLVREGVEVVFGIPGVQMYGMVVALRDTPGIRMITTRSEYSSTYMADGYARAKGSRGVGVALVVPGPGILNAAGGLSTAFSVSSRVMLIAGQTPRDTIMSYAGALHEVDDQLDTIRPVTKWQGRMLTPADIPETMREAFWQVRNGRPRPVHVELPPEAMLELADLDLLEPAPVERPVPGDALIQKAARLIAGANNPVIYAGSGILRGDAVDELRAITDRFNLPVMVSRGGKGAIPDGHANFYGSVSRGKGRLAQELGAADVVLVVGSRLTIGRPSNDVKLIQIDADAHEIALRKDDTLALVGDAKATLSRLSDALDDTNAAKRSSPAERVAAAREHLKGPEEHFEPQHTLTMAIRDGFPDDGIAIFGVTQLGYYSRPNWPVHEPGTYIDSGYSENLGFAFPTAIGAKVAQPDKPVICITGDGGFGYHTPELSTAVKYGINLVTVVFNDGHYGNVARDLDMDFGGQYEVDLVNPDYMELAHAYGAAGIRCDDHTKLSSAVADAVQMDRPVLLEVPVERMPRPSAPEDRPVWTKPQS